MDNLLSISLEAHHPERNHHRWYEISVGHDLLGDWTVCIRYGRTGQSGQERRFSTSDAKAIKAVIHEHLQKRLSAPRRIGCAYQLREVTSATGMNVEDHLPGETLSKFMTIQSNLSAH